MSELKINLDELEKQGNPFTEKISDFIKSHYSNELDLIVHQVVGKQQVSFDFKKLEEFDIGLAESLLKEPDYILEAFKSAITGYGFASLEEVETGKIQIRFFNLPDDRTFLIKNISSKEINQMVSVKGLVRKRSDRLPKLVKAVYECSKCGAVEVVPQPSNFEVKPFSCSACKSRMFKLIEDKSEFIDYQKIQIQECLENVDGAENPATIDIYVSGSDIINQVNPGDESVFTGMLRIAKPKDKKTVYGNYLEGLHIEDVRKEFESLKVLDEEEKEIIELSKDPQLFDKLVESISPDIYGHEEIKEAIVLQLFGGVEKNFRGKEKRGRIHILLVGDPGTAKTALLKASDLVSPKSMYVDGPAMSKAGITATAEKDDFGDGGWTLKAGAMVLANNGNVYIDEFEKAGEEDIEAMHQALESGEINISKASISAKLKAKVSALCACNPKYSRFDPYQNFLEQISIPFSLQSRFDLIFLIRDVLDAEKDRLVVNRIHDVHLEGAISLSTSEKLLSEEQKEKIQKIKSSFKYAGEKDGLIELSLITKYVSFAKQNVFPIMTPEAKQILTDFYITLRKKGKKTGTFTSTHRQEEGLIRLSEASAKARLSGLIEEQDAKRAIRLLTKTLELLIDSDGLIDIDILSGTSHSTQQKITKIKQTIKESYEITTTELLQKLPDIEKEEINKLIQRLKKDGQIYEPKHGTLKYSH